MLRRVYMLILMSHVCSAAITYQRIHDLIPGVTTATILYAFGDQDSNTLFAVPKTTDGETFIVSMSYPGLVVAPPLALPVALTGPGCVSAAHRLAFFATESGFMTIEYPWDPHNPVVEQHGGRVNADYFLCQEQQVLMMSATQVQRTWYTNPSASDTFRIGNSGITLRPGFVVDQTANQYFAQNGAGISVADLSHLGGMSYSTVWPSGPNFLQAYSMDIGRDGFNRYLYAGGVPDDRANAQTPTTVIKVGLSSDNPPRGSWIGDLAFPGVLFPNVQWAGENRLIMQAQGPSNKENCFYMINGTTMSVSFTVCEGTNTGNMAFHRFCDVSDGIAMYAVTDPVTKDTSVNALFVASFNGLTLPAPTYADPCPPGFVGPPPCTSIPSQSGRFVPSSALAGAMLSPLAALLPLSSAVANALLLLLTSCQAVSIVTSINVAWPNTVRRVGNFYAWSMLRVPAFGPADTSAVSPPSRSLLSLVSEATSLGVDPAALLFLLCAFILVTIAVILLQIPVYLAGCWLYLRCRAPLALRDEHKLPWERPWSRMAAERLRVLEHVKWCIVLLVRVSFAPLAQVAAFQLTIRPRALLVLAVPILVFVLVRPVVLHLWTQKYSPTPLLMPGVYSVKAVSRTWLSTELAAFVPAWRRFAVVSNLRDLLAAIVCGISQTVPVFTAVGLLIVYAISQALVVWRRPYQDTKHAVLSGVRAYFVMISAAFSLALADDTSSCAQSATCGTAITVVVVILGVCPTILELVMLLYAVGSAVRQRCSGTTAKQPLLPSKRHPPSLEAPEGDRGGAASSDDFSLLHVPTETSLGRSSDGCDEVPQKVLEEDTSVAGALAFSTGGPSSSHDQPPHSLAETTKETPQDAMCAAVDASLSVEGGGEVQHEDSHAHHPSNNSPPFRGETTKETPHDSTCAADDAAARLSVEKMEEVS